MLLTLGLQGRSKEMKLKKPLAEVKIIRPYHPFIPLQLLQSFQGPSCPLLGKAFGPLLTLPQPTSKCTLRPLLSPLSPGYKNRLDYTLEVSLIIRKSFSCASRVPYLSTFFFLFTLLCWKILFSHLCAQTTTLTLGCSLPKGLISYSSSHPRT